MRLTDLGDIDWVKNNISDVLKAKQIIEAQLDTIKNEVKLAKGDTTIGNVNFKYSSFKKLKPKDLDSIIRQYPIADYPDIYNISLSKEAQHIITDESLFEEQDIEMIRIELPD